MVEDNARNIHEANKWGLVADSHWLCNKFYTSNTCMRVFNKCTAHHCISASNYILCGTSQYATMKKVTPEALTTLLLIAATG